MALQTAISEFDHDEDWKHDEELDLHADKILFQKLAFCFASDPGSVEVAMICTALEMVYRASRQRIAMSFAELRDSVLPIFVAMLDQPLRFRKLGQLQQAILEARKKNSSRVGGNVRDKSMQDSYTTSGHTYSKTKKFMDEDNQTYATYDDYPKKAKNLDEDDRTYATYDDYPKKAKNLDEDDRTYATYDDYPKKAKNLDEDDQTNATYDYYPKKAKNLDEDDQTYATYDDYPKKAKNLDEFDQTYYPKKSMAVGYGNDSYAKDDDYPKKHVAKGHGNDSYATYDDSPLKPKKKNIGDQSKSTSNSKEETIADDDNEAYATFESHQSKKIASAYSGSENQGDDSHGGVSYIQGKGNVKNDEGDPNGDDEADNEDSLVKSDNRKPSNDDCNIHTSEDDEVNTLVSDDTYGKPDSKPNKGDDRSEDKNQEFSKNQPSGDSTIYTMDGMHSTAKGSREEEFDDALGDSKESGSNFAESLSVEKSFFNRHATPPEKVRDLTPSVKTVSTHARSLREKKTQQEEGAENSVIQRLESELAIIRFEVPTNSVAIGRSLQVLRYFSRVFSAMVQLAHHPGMLDALIYQLERQPYGKHKQQFFEYENGEPRLEDELEELEAARIDAIATIVNLACAEENKTMIARHKGLLDAIITVAQNDDSEEAREHAAIVIMNLAYDDENKVCLSCMVCLCCIRGLTWKSYHLTTVITLQIMMVQHQGMLKTLVTLLQEKSPFTRRYASAALFTLACVVGNTERIASFCDGEILECLRRVLEHDPVDEARINSAEAMFNMARNNTAETVQIMADHPRLLATLAKSILTDYSADVRLYCARALEWMSADVHHPMECHRTLLSALTVSAQWTKANCIAEAIKTQAILPENRLPMAAHDGFLQALSNLALLERSNDADIRKSAIAALEMVSREPAARKYMVHNEQVMRSLTIASFAKRYGEDDLLGENEEEGTATTKMIKNALKNLADNL